MFYPPSLSLPSTFKRRQRDNGIVLVLLHRAFSRFHCWGRRREGGRGEDADDRELVEKILHAPKTPLDSIVFATQAAIPGAEEGGKGGRRDIRMRLVVAARKQGGKEGRREGEQVKIRTEIQTREASRLGW